MELIRDRLPTEQIQKYRTAYRTLALNTQTTRLNFTRVLFEDGKIFTETDLLYSHNLYFLWLLTDFIPFANSLETPWVITNGDSFLLDKIHFTNDDLRVLEQKGLNIFMYEPLFLLNSDKSWPWIEKKGQPHFVELEEISRLQNRLGIKINVCVCELDMPEYLKAQALYPNLNIYGFSTLLMHEAVFRKTLPWPQVPTENITKHLISLNFRYESVREMLVGYLVGKNHFDKCSISFFHTHDEREFLKRLPFVPQELSQWYSIEKGIRDMQTRLPFTLDSANTSAQHPVHGRIPDMDGVHNQRRFDVVKENFMSTAFAFVYCESRPFSPRGEISEKTLDALQAMKPFIVFAAPYFLKKMRELGFKTFSKYWSEDYDLIEDPRKRFEAFLKVVDFICSQDLTTLHTWSRDMASIVEHNRLLFLRHLVPQHQQALKNALKT